MDKCFCKEKSNKSSDSPKFALNWLTELGHDYLNTINVADDDFSDFLRKHFDDLKVRFREVFAAKFA